MKTNKSLGEFVLNVWATIVRTIMPRVCVKCLTLKNRKNAQRYLLGAEKELKLIDKFHFSNEQIAGRVWSHQTKVALLHRGDTVLLSEVKTEEEFDAVLALRNARHLVAAARVYTPNRAKMVKLCASLEPQMLCALAKEVPSSFESLSVKEILGEKETSIPTTRERWAVALTLAKARPEWAPKFLLQLREIVPSKLGEEGNGLMTDFFDIAYNANVDMSQMMAYFFVIRPDLYRKIRENWSRFEIASYFIVMFPQLLGDLTKSLDASFEEIKTVGNLTPTEEAYAWLKIGYECLNEPAVYGCLWTTIAKVKEHVLPRLFEQLFHKMVGKAPSAQFLLGLYKVADVPEKTAIPATFVALVEAQREKAATLRQVFPFKGWPENIVIRAIKAMVAGNAFPIKHIGKLLPEMQKIAFEEMETHSQIECINGGEVLELIERSRLYPAAEVHLLSCGGYLKKAQAAYIEKWQLDETTFSWLLQTVKLPLERKEEIVFAYATKWGLSKEDYMQLMQSRLADKAPLLKRYLKA